MDIYLDNIVIYSDCLEDHIKHVKIVLDILKREKLYLSQSKLRFIVPELKLLGCIVNNQGIRMDTGKCLRIRTYSEDSLDRSDT